MTLPKLFKLLWIEEMLPTDIISASMRGGQGYYLDEKLVLIIVETGTTYEHRGVTYPFKIWNGCFFPIEKIKQNAVFAKFQFLENHPALKDSLYLPADSEDFAEEVQQVIREIKKKNPLFGTRFKKSVAAKQNTKLETDDLDTSRPKTFGDTPKVQRVTKEKSVKPLDQLQKKTKLNVSKKADNNFLLSVLKRRSK